MSDKELLELAAKAADIGCYIGMCADAYQLPENWNPLTDDGDALRLAVKLQIQVTPGTYRKDEFTAYNSAMHAEAHEYWSTQQNEGAATRRAIVRAAAAIGEQTCT